MHIQFIKTKISRIKSWICFLICSLFCSVSEPNVFGCNKSNTNYGQERYNVTPTNRAPALMTLWSICGTFTENKHYFYMYISVHAGAFSLNTTVMCNLQTSRRANMLWFLVITELFYDLNITNLNVHFLNIIIWFKKKHSDMAFIERQQTYSNSLNATHFDIIIGFHFCKQINIPAIV